MTLRCTSHCKHSTTVSLVFVSQSQPNPDTCTTRLHTSQAFCCSLTPGKPFVSPLAMAYMSHLESVHSNRTQCNIVSSDVELFKCQMVVLACFPSACLAQKVLLNVDFYSTFNRTARVCSKHLFFQKIRKMRRITVGHRGETIHPYIHYPFHDLLRVLKFLEPIQLSSG